MHCNSSFRSMLYFCFITLGNVMSGMGYCLGVLVWFAWLVLDLVDLH